MCRRSMSVPAGALWRGDRICGAGCAAGLSAAERVMAGWVFDSWIVSAACGGLVCTLHQKQKEGGMANGPAAARVCGYTDGSDVRCAVSDIGSVSAVTALFVGAVGQPVWRGGADRAAAVSGHDYGRVLPGICHGLCLQKSVGPDPLMEMERRGLLRGGRGTDEACPEHRFQGHHGRQRCIYGGDPGRDPAAWKTTREKSKKWCLKHEKTTSCCVPKKLSKNRKISVDKGFFM